jgi:hypothetical protein
MSSRSTRAHLVRCSFKTPACTGCTGASQEGRVSTRQGKRCIIVRRIRGQCNRQIGNARRVKALTQISWRPSFYASSEQVIAQYRKPTLSASGQTRTEWLDATNDRSSIIGGHPKSLGGSSARCHLQKSLSRSLRLRRGLERSAVRTCSSNWDGSARCCTCWRRPPCAARAWGRESARGRNARRPAPTSGQSCHSRHCVRIRSRRHKRRPGFLRKSPHRHRFADIEAHQILTNLQRATVRPSRLRDEIIYACR